MKYVIGNWKMQLSVTESNRLAEEVTQLIGAWVGGADVTVVVCPTHLGLVGVSSVVSDTAIALGAQDCFWEDRGAFTGEVSAASLKDIGCSYCLVGHSERRQYLGETDEMVNKKTAALLRLGITPVVCVGETREEREQGKREAIVTGQVRAALRDLRLVGTQRLIVAYEPRWVIGSGKPVSPTDAAEMHHLIVDTLHQLLGEDVTNRLCSVIYGGAVDSSNVAGFMAVPVIQGVLVGGASLKPQEFQSLVAAVADRQS